MSCAPTWVHFHELVRQFVSDLLKPFLVTLLLSRYQVVVDTPTLVGTLDHLHSDQGCDSKVGTLNRLYSDQGCDSKVGTLDHLHSDQGCDSKVGTFDHLYSDQGCDSKVGTLDHPHSDQGYDSKVANTCGNPRSPAQ